jgi:anaerobic selenocysteine-containing dehydrogenase
MISDTRVYPNNITSIPKWVVEDLGLQRGDIVLWEKNNGSITVAKGEFRKVIRKGVGCIRNSSE